MPMRTAPSAAVLVARALVQRSRVRRCPSDCAKTRATEKTAIAHSVACRHRRAPSCLVASSDAIQAEMPCRAERGCTQNARRAAARLLLSARTPSKQSLVNGSTERTARAAARLVVTGTPLACVSSMATALSRSPTPSGTKNASEPGPEARAAAPATVLRLTATPGLIAASAT